MHQPTETARWYRRVDPNCFTGQAAPSVPDPPSAGRLIRRVAAAPASWLTLAGASLAWAVMAAA